MRLRNVRAHVNPAAGAAKGGATMNATAPTAWIVEPGEASPNIAVRRALIAAFFLGWSLLPVLDYPQSPDTRAIVGIALPGANLITKAALLPVVLCLFALILSDLRRLRPNLLDIALLLFCAVPLLHGRPLDALYLLGAWGGTWALGRLLVATPGARRDALTIAAAAGLLLLPVAVLEGLRPAWLYGTIYAPHPYADDGVVRYLGYRPIGFFEHGNQYGIWIAMAALAAIELARDDRRWRWGAGVLVAMALAAQSAGAIVLLGIGAAALLLRPTPPRWLLPLTGAVVIAGAAVFLSGVIPIDHLVRDTAPGQALLDAFGSVGRGSFPWRISQDLRVLPLIAEHPLIGQGTTDWWRPVNARPWDLPMLVIGQYGAIGLILLAAPMLAGAVSIINAGERDERFALAVIILLAGADALLNSAIYFPAILFAGALAGRARA